MGITSGMIVDQGKWERLWVRVKKSRGTNFSKWWTGTHDIFSQYHGLAIFASSAGHNLVTKVGNWGTSLLKEDTCMMTTEATQVCLASFTQCKRGQMHKFESTWHACNFQVYTHHVHGDIVVLDHHFLHTKRCYTAEKIENYLEIQNITYSLEITLYINIWTKSIQIIPVNRSTQDFINQDEFVIYVLQAVVKQSHKYKYNSTWVSDSLIWLFMHYNEMSTALRMIMPVDPISKQNQY